MKSFRLLVTLLGCVITAIAAADDYPNKAIRFIMPYPIGGSIDIAGRMVAQRLADNLGQAVVVDNRTGAGGIVGTETGAHAAPDGYTLLLTVGPPHSAFPFFMKNVPFDTVRDFSPIIVVGTAGGGTRRQDAAFAVTTLSDDAIERGLQVVETLVDGRNAARTSYQQALSDCQAAGLPTRALDDADVARLGRIAVAEQMTGRSLRRLGICDHANHPGADGDPGGHQGRL